MAALGVFSATLRCLTTAALRSQRRAVPLLRSLSSSTSTSASPKTTTFITPPNRTKAGRPAGLRKPDSVTEQEWLRMRPGRRRQLSHMGYIDETEWGMAAETPCAECKHAGSSCRLYKKEARVAASTCSACQRYGRACSYAGQSHSKRASSNEGPATASGPPGNPLHPGRLGVHRKPDFLSQEQWEGLSAKRATDLSHVGYINETKWGVPAPEACERCAANGADCRVYSDLAGISSFACGRCRYLGRSCSHTVDGRKPLVRVHTPERNRRKTVAAENAALKEELGRLREEIVRLRGMAS